MAITQSAKKALRQSERRNSLNQMYKKRMKNLIKKAHSLITEKKLDEVKKLMPEIYAALDKAAKSNVIKKNSAGRKKSRIMKLIARLS